MHRKFRPGQDITQSLAPHRPISAALKSGRSVRCSAASSSIHPHGNGALVGDWAEPYCTCHTATLTASVRERVAMVGSVCRARRRLPWPRILPRLVPRLQDEDPARRVLPQHTQVRLCSCGRQHFLLCKCCLLLCGLIISIVTSRSHLAQFECARTPRKSRTSTNQPHRQINNNDESNTSQGASATRSHLSEKTWRKSLIADSVTVSWTNLGQIIGTESTCWSESRPLAPHPHPTWLRCSNALYWSAYVAQVSPRSTECEEVNHLLAALLSLSVILPSIVSYPLLW